MCYDFSAAIQQDVFANAGSPRRVSFRPETTCITFGIDDPPIDTLSCQPARSVLPFSLPFAEDSVQSPVDASLLQPLKSPSNVDEQLAIIKAEHARGHFGSRAVHRALTRDNFSWKGMSKQVHQVCSGCLHCQKWNRARVVSHPIRPVNAYWPWDLLEIDFITSFKECDGFSTIMVCTDVFSSFTLLRALVDRSAATVATELVQIFSDFGSPRVIRTDGDGTWVSQALNAMFEIFGVRHDYIIPYNSRALGKVERHVDTASQMIRKTISASGKSWVDILPLAQLYMNRKHRELSDSTPFEIIFTRSPNNFRSSDAVASESADIGPSAISQDDFDTWSSAQHSLLHSILPAIRKNLVDK